ncbi:pentatricopeptide repeat-containing protein At3g18020 [Arachis duranensis]|uniref:Pentatricopeptide repeat-containing protein At3g18020 n=1 Tax=Arachis duranensis TaxID=130453 RepID=A0A9C6TGS9_ARADU|nr:pentatricopeptide repeat-containing protein At3g18020 [Arachis duranensis]
MQSRTTTFLIHSKSKPFFVLPSLLFSTTIHNHTIQHGQHHHSTTTFHNRNLVAIIHSLCDAHRFDEAHNIFSLFLSSGFLPDHHTSNVLLSRLLSSRTPHRTWACALSLIQANHGFVPSIVTYHRLMDHFCRFGQPQQAHILFFDMKGRGHCPNVVSYTTLINGYCLIGGIGDARKVFDEMLDSGIAANSLTYSVLVGGFLRMRDIEGAKGMMCQLWEKMRVEREASMKMAAFANLVDSLCRGGFFNELFRIAEEFALGGSLCEEVAYGQMIDSLCKVGRYHAAARIVYIMRKRGLVPSVACYNYIIHGFSKDGDCMRAYQLLEEAEFGFLLSEHTYKVLVEALCQVLDVDKARKVLEHMLSREGVNKTRIYNTYLRALCIVDNPTELLNVLVLMLQSQCHADVITLNAVINGFCKVGRIDEALTVLQDMLSGKFSAPNVVTFTTIISGLLDTAKIDEAVELLHKVMPENGVRPSVATYNAFLRGLFKLKRPNDALRAFNNMASNGITADSTTYTVVVDGLCESNQIDELIDLELPRIMRDQKQHMRKLPRDKRCLLPKHMESAANMAKELRNWREVVSFSRKGVGIDFVKEQVKTNKMNFMAWRC